MRNLGKVVHYSKVRLRFQHSQDISDCYLELFPSHLYFQAHGSEGLTFQVSGTDGGREGLCPLGVPAAPPILSCGRDCSH